VSPHENTSHKKTYDLGSEVRTIEWGEKEDGTVFVTEKSCGDLTKLVYDAAEHHQTLVFTPTDGYSVKDVANTVMSAGDDCSIGNFEDALTLWGIPYTRDERTVPLVA